MKRVLYTFLTFASLGAALEIGRRVGQLRYKEDIEPALKWAQKKLKAHRGKREDTKEARA